MAHIDWIGLAITNFNCFDSRFKRSTDIFDTHYRLDWRSLISIVLIQNCINWYTQNKGNKEGIEGYLKSSTHNLSMLSTGVFDAQNRLKWRSLIPKIVTFYQLYGISKTKEIK